jgi:hypothetical protein
MRRGASNGARFPPKVGEGSRNPVTLPARRSGAPGAVPPGDAGYFWRCFTCGCLLALSPADAVVAEARAIIGDLTIVFCGGCVARMVDGA